MQDLEAILLTGGASRRMGVDKAKILIDGEELAVRIARLLSEIGIAVTVCGRESISGHGFQRDREEFAGPLAALAEFTPSCEFVFVASCDLIGFNPTIVEILAHRIEGHGAAIPVLDDRLQPLCGLYEASAIVNAGVLSSSGERRIMSWVDSLDYVAVEGIERSWLTNANSPEDLR